MAFTVIDDGQERWVAATDRLIEAMDNLGWQQTTRLSNPARVQPDAEATEDSYSRLCACVQAIDIEPDDSMGRLTWYPAEQAWIWD